MYAHVVAVNVRRRRFAHGGVEPEADAPLQLRLEAFRRPAVAHKEVFEAGALAVLTQAVRVAEDFGDALDDGDHLVPADEGVQPQRKIRLGRQPAAHAQ